MLRVHKEIINEFRRLKDAKIVIFGSVARGNYGLDSDIDIAIISNNDVRERARKIADSIFAKYGKLVSLKFLNEEEFKKGKSPLVKEIRRGIIWKTR
ncbi:MAG: hypothetical protein DRP03_01345 [Candidatus Aenigmatarchaeota archaeon]|nr:MAG: hypothetical protein DRP03_01345 [Candidatus Aenigmarchaeota archaeon]